MDDIILKIRFLSLWYLIQSINIFFSFQDPYRMDDIIRKKKSTPEDPNIVYGCNDRRMIGCVCHEHACVVAWKWLYKGEPDRCGCGHWFKLEYVDPV